MKTKLFALALGVFAFFLSFSTALADPLNNWSWRNPLPNGNPPPSAQNLYGIVFTNGQFFAVGANGVEVTSTDGTNWTQRATATTNQLNDIIYGNGQFMAVGNNGAVETSANGTNWVVQISGTSAALGSVAYGNGKYVAVGANTVIASSDGAAWSPATSGPSGALEVAGGSSGFVAVNGGPNAFFSANGLTWATNSLPIPEKGFNGEQFSAQMVTYAKGVFLTAGSIYPFSDEADFFVLSSPDGNNWPTNVLFYSTLATVSDEYRFFMSGSSPYVFIGAQFGSDQLLYSSNILNWSYTETANAGSGNAGTYGNGLYVIVKSTQTMYTSTDGLNWITNQFNPSAAVGPNSTFNSITYSNGVYIVASSSSFAIATNESAFVTETNSPSLASVITYSNTFVGVGSSGQIYQSGDGITWTQRNSGTANNLNSVAGGSGLLVAVGNNGAVQTSPTGTIWTSRLSGTSLPLYGVAYSNGLYVAVGQQGTVVTSPDGINWTVQDSGQLKNLLSVTYGAAGFLAAGANGTILTSPDGANWTQQSSGTSTTLESAAFGNGYYLVTGPNALVMTSPDGVNWTSRNVGAPGGPTLYGSAFLNGRFDVVGSSGTVLESGLVPPLFDLQMHAKPFQNVFSVFATPGSSFRILSSATVDAPTWSTAATINNAAAITLWTNNAAAGNQNYFRLVSP
jgi:hypothetical protein